ncbi:hypothetical protein IF1G_08561 [Cordyceps javanica]|uniref:Uncharacterized protein n=1 Tax=Cordyceps javanica TaxID=43265 RepID=A0A545UT34_9HYPO|nr:hypothetical protein IF1G_08561 [Cordyceps javanica]
MQRRSGSKRERRRRDDDRGGIGKGNLRRGALINRPLTIRQQTSPLWLGTWLPLPRYMATVAAAPLLILPPAARHPCSRCLQSTYTFLDGRGIFR